MEISENESEHVSARGRYLSWRKILVGVAGLAVGMKLYPNYSKISYKWRNFYF